MSVSVNTVAASRNFNPLSLQKITFCPRSLGIETQFSMIRVNMGSFLFLLKMKYFNSYLSFHSYSPSSRKLSKKYEKLVLSNEYTLFQNGRHFSILLFPWKLALLASLSNFKFNRIFNLERDQKGQFAIKQKNTKMAQPFW